MVSLHIAKILSPIISIKMLFSGLATAVPDAHWRRRRQSVPAAGRHGFVFYLIIEIPSRQIVQLRVFWTSKSVRPVRQVVQLRVFRIGNS